MKTPLVRPHSAARLISALAAVTSASAEIVTFDLDSYPIPPTTSLAINTPYDEDGLRMTSSVVSFFLVGQGSQSFTGRRAITPGSSASGQPTTVSLFSPAGRFFAVRSVTLHPYIAGTAVNVGFTGFYNGNGSIQAHSTGTALSGTTVTFNSNFEKIGNLSWLMQAVGGVYQRFQISSIVVEFEGVLTTPATMTVAEAAGTASVPIQLDSPRTTATTVTWEVMADSATQPADFTFPGGNSSGTLTIPAGQTTAFVNVPIVNDTTNESPETFRVTFTAPSAGNLFPSGATSIQSAVTIASDDGVANFPAWMTAHGLTSTAATAEADPNGDGISNIESWLFRLNPAGPNPPAWLSRRAALNSAPSDPGLRMVIPLPLPTDVRIIFSQSTGLDTWSEQTRRTGFAVGSLWTGSGAARVVESNSLSARTVTLRASVPGGPRPKLFLRNAYEYVNSGGSD